MRSEDTTGATLSTGDEDTELGKRLSKELDAFNIAASGAADFGSLSVKVTMKPSNFQAPGFYQRHGYVETGQTLGIPGGNADVHMFKSLTDRQDV